MKELLMQPVDTFFFRNHKDFTPGESSTPGHVFPPRPGTVYGALRSAYIHAHTDFTRFVAGSEPAVCEWMGTPEGVGRFSMRGTAVWAQGQMMLPLPLDYQVVREKSGDGEYEFAWPLQLRQNESGRSSDGRYCHLLGPYEGKSVSPAGSYLALDQWKQELLDPRGTRITRAASWLMAEEKLGIAIDGKTRTTIPGMLYQIAMNRFVDSLDPAAGPGIIAICEDAPEFDSVKYLRLGGKNRPWNLTRKSDDFCLLSDQEEREAAGRIREIGSARLILLTPAIWREDSEYYHKAAQKISLGAGLEFPIIAMATGKPLLVGGWDIVHNRPKQRSQALPAGSVVHIKVAPDQAGDLMKAIRSISISDELSNEGYGWVACGPGYQIQKI